MKNTNKKGFTLVELAIVIAVIAILAAVLIFTFASVLRKANDSARVQQIKNEEIAQKADDIIKKIDDSKWFGWEDFEADIVEKITKAVKNDTDKFTKEDLENVVKDAVTTAIANVTINNSDLTEDQIKAIVENALGTLKYEGVTEAQVRAIVSASEANVKGSQLTAAQVRLIVNAANDNNLTAAQVAEIVGGANFSTTTDVQSAVTTITTALSNATSGLATSAQAEEIKVLIENIATTIATNDLDDVVLAKSLNIKLAKSNKTINTPSDVVDAINQPNPVDAVSTINLVLLDLENETFIVVTADKTNGYHKVVYAANIATGEDLHNEYKYWTFKKETSTSATYSEFSVYLLNDSDVETITLQGVGLDVGKNENVSTITYEGAGDSHNVVIRTNGGKLIVDDQHLATINHYGNLTSLDIVECHTESYHEFGNVICVNIKKGHIAFEENSSVESVHFEKKDRETDDPTVPDTYNPIIVSFADGVEQPEYSRDKTIIDPVDGTKVCTLSLPEETNNIYLTLQGIYEQIKIEAADISGNSTGSQEWVNTSNATNETKVASDQIANQYKNRASALEQNALVADVAGAENTDGQRTFDDQDLQVIDEIVTESGDTKTNIESKYTVNSIFADYLKLESIPGEDILPDGYNIGLRADEIKSLYASNKDAFNNIVYGVNYDDKGTTDDDSDDELLLQNGRSYIAVDEDSYKQDDEKYRYWHGDFVISFNKDISAFDKENIGNNIILAGEYGDWGWLKFPLVDGLAANTKLRLLDSYMGGIITINYEELCTLVKTFKCGAAYIAPEGYDTSDPLIITIEFRLYETSDNPTTHNEEIDNSIIVDTYQYIFN